MSGVSGEIRSVEADVNASHDIMMRASKAGISNHGRRPALARRCEKAEKRRKPFFCIAKIVRDKTRFLCYHVIAWWKPRKFAENISVLYLVLPLLSSWKRGEKAENMRECACVEDNRPRRKVLSYVKVLLKMLTPQGFA